MKEAVLRDGLFLLGTGAAEPCGTRVEVEVGDERGGAPRAQVGGGINKNRA